LWLTLGGGVAFPPSLLGLIFTLPLQFGNPVQILTFLASLLDESCTLLFFLLPLGFRCGFLCFFLEAQPFLLLKAL